jgi:hypothetical protein
MADRPLIPADLLARLQEILGDARRGRYDGGRIVLEVDPAGEITSIVSELRVKHRRAGGAA